MRFLLLIIVFYSGGLLAQSRIYDISIQTVSGKTLNMSDYKGKKIMVASVSADNLQKGQLRFLDSLQVNNSSITVIVVPATDFKGTNDSVAIDGVKKNSSLHLVVSAAEAVKKSNGAKQNKLLQWLTSASANTHFDIDVTTDSQLYMISESGVLYAVLEKGASNALINQLIKQPDIKE